MHRLILMRHAEAQGAPAGAGDRERPLSAVGRDAAARMGRALSQRGLRPDVALVSSSTRTRQTWDLLQDAFGDVEVRVDETLYNAAAGALRACVEAAEEHAGCLLVLAHNPGIQLLAGEYLVECAASPALLERLVGGFPPGAAAVFAVDAAGRCGYEGYLTPRDLGAEG